MLEFINEFKTWFCGRKKSNTNNKLFTNAKYENKGEKNTNS